MLVEFLVTPDALSDDLGTNGAEVVEKIKNCLLPTRTAPIAVLCKLGDDRWEVAASKKISRIPNSNHRNAAMALFKLLQSELCVTRIEGSFTSGDESEWVTAGLCSKHRVPLDKIVVSTKIEPPADLGVSIKDLLTDAFWDLFENPRAVGRDLASQEKVLRTICMHSDWIILRLPYVKGGCDDEIVTVKQIVRLSSQLRASRNSSLIELHICSPDRVDLKTLIYNVADELADADPSRVRIRLAIWPKEAIVSRELLAGDFAKTSPGDLKHRARWWITMNHVAIGNKNRSQSEDSANTWALFPRSKAHRRFEEIRSAQPLLQRDLGNT